MTTNGSAPGASLVQDAAPQDGRPIVELRGAGKSYGNVRALHGVSLAVSPSRGTARSSNCAARASPTATSVPCTV